MKKDISKEPEMIELKKLQHSLPENRQQELLTNIQEGIMAAKKLPQPETKQIEGITLHNTAKIAELLDIDYQTAINNISSGRIKARKIGRSYWVTAANLKEFLTGTDNQFGDYSLTP